MKNSRDDINSRLGIIRERTGKLENITKETHQRTKHFKGQRSLTFLIWNVNEYGALSERFQEIPDKHSRKKDIIWENQYFDLIALFFLQLKEDMSLQFESALKC